MLRINEWIQKSMADLLKGNVKILAVTSENSMEWGVEAAPLLYNFLSYLNF